MAATFTIDGSWESAPASGAPSSDPKLTAPLDESVVLDDQVYREIDLAAATNQQALNFAGLTNAHVVVMRTVGGEVRARITTTQGTTQTVPIDGLFVLFARTSPVTAIDLSCTPAVTVKVFLGQE